MERAQASQPLPRNWTGRLVQLWTPPPPPSRPTPPPPPTQPTTTQPLTSSLPLAHPFIPSLL